MGKTRGIKRTVLPVLACVWRCAVYKRPQTTSPPFASYIALHLWSPPTNSRLFRSSCACVSPQRGGDDGWAIFANKKQPFALDLVNKRAKAHAHRRQRQASKQTFIFSFVVLSPYRWSKTRKDKIILPAKDSYPRLVTVAYTLAGLSSNCECVFGGQQYAERKKKRL